MIIPFSSCLQLSQHQGFFPMSQVFETGGQSIGVSASAWVLSMNIQDWFPLEWTGWISLKSKGLKSLLQHPNSKASVLRYSAFFIIQLSHPYMTTGKTIALTKQTFVSKLPSQWTNYLCFIFNSFYPNLLTTFTSVYCYFYLSLYIMAQLNLVLT